LTEVSYEYLKLALRSLSGPAKRIRAHFDEKPDEIADYEFDSVSENHENFIVEELILRPEG